MRKHITIIILLSLLINLVASTAFAKTDTTVSLTAPIAKLGDSFTVDVNIADNSGFSNLAIEIGYDSSVMELSGVQNYVTGASFTAAQSLSANPYNIQWDNASNVTFNGNAARLTFKALKAGNYPITISYYKGRDGKNVDGDDVNYDEDYNPLTLNYKGITVQIENAQNSIAISDLVNGTNITANIGLTSATADIDGIVYAGAYKDGKLVSVEKYDADSSLQLFIAKNNADTLKIMWFDNNMKPMCVAKEIALN